MNCLRLTLVSVLAVWVSTAAGQIFECIDANGNKEFTQKCPPGTKQREVLKGGTSTQNGTSSRPPTSYQEEEAAFRRRRLEREEAETKEAQARTAAEQKCKNARARLWGMENARRVRSGNDPQTCEPKYLDDAQRTEATENARKSVAAWCK